MKKTLLLLAAFAASSMAFAQIDITPKGYDFSQSNIVPEFRFQGANTPTPAYEGCGGDATWAKHNGLIAATGGQWANDAQPYWANLMAGWSFVDLGGEVGRCLCLYTPRDNGELKEFDFNETYGSKIPMATGGINWGNLHFFSDPEKTPKSPVGNKDMNTMTHVRVQIVLSIYDQLGEDRNFFNNIYTMDDQNNVKPAPSANGAAGSAIKTSEFFDPDTYEWKSDQWLQYEFDTYVQDTEDGISYSPLHLKMEIPGANFKGAVCFIKSIKFLEVNDVVQDGATGRKRTWLTLTPDLGNITDVISTVTAASNGKVYDLSGREASGEGRGLFIQNGKKVVK